MTRSPFLMLLSGCALGAAAVAAPLAATTRAQGTAVEMRLDASEAHAVLAILTKTGAGEAPDDGDWQRLFATEPYQRLKKREASMGRDFSDADFRRFVLSDDLARRAPLLRRTLEAWESADLRHAAQRILPYLPAGARVRAKVYPMIKPQSNSFVFETATDPAIFLYLDPELTPSAFENTVAHESHHIGYSGFDQAYEQRIATLPANARQAAKWVGAFGEGLAVLAAAGSIETHPLAAFEPADRARWDQDLKYFDQQLRQLDQFFFDLVNGGFAKPEVADHVAFTFFGYRGPWYTVGYRMAAVVEKRFGRSVLVDCMLDPRKLLAKYNEAATASNAEGRDKLPLWRVEVLTALGVAR